MIFQRKTTNFAHNYLRINVYINPDVYTLYITEIIISKSHRKKGYAKASINYLQNLYPTIRIELLSENNGFYEKLNFRNIGTGYRLP
ncbi:MAG TPA: hypothetical protein DCO67_01395 [Staphylococcus sp.]|nr:hypothetical protein [Staphylococcus sp.]